MGGLICCCWRTFCCECTICDKRDDWKIDDEIRPGELGAGFIYKKAKGSAMWSKRYFVLTPYKLCYFLERDRQAIKGEIILAGATATNSSTRANTKKKFYFNVSHPQCGVRELYVKSDNRRQQWIERINNVSQELTKFAVYGKLLKQGGLGKNIWQERWCISVRDSIDYFENPTDNQSKGTIVITNATINPIKVKDRFCFEVTASGPVKGGGKKANKKYVFACEKEFERDKWVELLKRNSIPPSQRQIDADGNEIVVSGHATSVEGTSPLHSTARGDDDEGDENSATEGSQSNLTQSMIVNTSLCGYLQKKSPAVMKGWQKRYFRTEANGDISYFKSEEESKKPNGELKGVLHMRDIVAQPLGIQFNEKTYELTLQLQGKKVFLKASSLDEGTEWTQNIINCVDALQASGRA
jgi:hypothetical protein